MSLSRLNPIKHIDVSDTSAAIRGYESTDWPDICRVYDLARVQELTRSGVDLRAFKPMVEAAETGEFSTSRTLVACDRDKVAGFVSWKEAYITWLYVDPDYQRRGIGRRLLDEAMIHTGPGAWTNALGGNEPAVTLYERRGMEVVWSRVGDCEGYPCTSLRLALPTSRMRDPSARRFPGAKS